MVDKQGYLSPQYAGSLGAIGRSIPLESSKGYLLKRTIDNFPYNDAIGCYPLFCCSNWDMLGNDLNNIQDSIVSVALVTDPLGEYSFSKLKAIFTDVCYPYKTHYLVYLELYDFDHVQKNHRRNAESALKSLQIERLEKPDKYFDDWIELYHNLVIRHAIKGFADFSEESFKKQFATDGLIMYRASYNDTTVGMVMFYEMNNNVYYHLGAYSDDGYSKRASFAIFKVAIEYFKYRGYKWLNATGTAYFCGKIINKEAYQKMCLKKNISGNGYFPLYRKTENNSEESLKQKAVL